MLLIYFLASFFDTELELNLRDSQNELDKLTKDRSDTGSIEVQFKVASGQVHNICENLKVLSAIWNIVSIIPEFISRFVDGFGSNLYHSFVMMLKCSTNP